MKIDSPSYETCLKTVIFQLQKCLSPDPGTFTMRNVEDVEQFLSWIRDKTALFSNTHSQVEMCTTWAVSVFSSV